MFSPKILGLKVEMFGTQWTVQNCVEKLIFRVPGQAGRDQVFWVASQRAHRERSKDGSACSTHDMSAARMVESVTLPAPRRDTSVATRSTT